MERKLKGISYKIDENLVEMFNLYTEATWQAKTPIIEKILYNEMKDWFENNADKFPAYVAFKKNHPNIDYTDKKKKQ